MKMGMLEKVPMNVANPLSPGIRHVIDGGSLLHHIRWPMKVITYGQLVDRYVQYVDRQYGPNSQVIIDGYPENTPTTKDEKDTCVGKEKLQLQISVLIKPSL